MDRRIKYTKMIIRQSFIELLRERHIEKISVTDICKSADINRATFYRYYDNQYDLLSSIENEILEEIKIAVFDKTKDIDALIELIFSLFCTRKEEWTLLLSDHADSRFISKIYMFFDGYFKKDNFSDEGKMRYQFLLYGFSGLFDYWVKTGMKEAPEKMAEYAIKFRHDLMCSIKQ